MFGHGWGVFERKGPVRQAAMSFPIDDNAQSQGKINVPLNPHAQAGSDWIPADRAGDARTHQSFDYPFKIVEV